MIMPCINAMSAFDLCGATPEVEDGSFLLGVPGAPGCTTETESVAACRAYPAVAGMLQSHAAILNFLICPCIFAAHTVSRSEAVIAIGNRVILRTTRSFRATSGSKLHFLVSLKSRSQ